MKHNTAFFCSFPPPLVLDIHTQTQEKNQYIPECAAKSNTSQFFHSPKSVPILSLNSYCSAFIRQMTLNESGHECAVNIRRLLEVTHGRSDDHWLPEPSTATDLPRLRLMSITTHKQETDFKTPLICRDACEKHTRKQSCVISQQDSHGPITL